MTKTETLTIGQLAASAGVGRETIRYYERKGLLEEPPRSAAGYRHYPPDVPRRLRFICRAQELGFTLAEISGLLDLRVDEVSACAAVETRAREKLEVAVKESMKATVSGVGGVLAATGSALCCAGPVVAVSLGVSGAGLSAFEPFRPYFLGATAAFLATAPRGSSRSIQP